MPEIQDVGASSTANCLIYADSGWGKTSLIGERGDLKVLLIRPPIENADPIIGKGVKELITRDWEDMDEVQAMMRHIAMDEWDWVWWDGLGGWQDVGLHDIYQDALDRAGPVGSAARKHREQFYTDKGEFRINAERISGFVRDMVSNTAFNFGITAYPQVAAVEKVDPDDETGEEIVMPYIQVKGMVHKICGYMNIVGFGDMASRKRGERVIEVRRLHTNKSQRHYAKCQLKTSAGASIFGEDGIIINPTLEKIHQAVGTRVGSARRPRGRRPVRTRTATR